MTVSNYDDLTKEAHNKFIIPVGGFVSSMSDSQEWDLLAPMIELYAPKGSKSTKPSIKYSVILQRKPDWYVLNHMMIFSINSTLTFALYAVDV